MNSSVVVQELSAELTDERTANAVRNWGGIISRGRSNIHSAWQSRGRGTQNTNCKPLADFRVLGQSHLEISNNAPDPLTIFASTDFNAASRDMIHDRSGIRAQRTVRRGGPLPQA